MEADSQDLNVSSDDFVFDPYAVEFAENPYPIYRHLRDNAPVYHQEQMNFWMLTRYEDVWQAHRDARNFSSAAGVTIERSDGREKLLLTTDAPYHSWAKAMMAKVFSRARMEALDDFIRNKAAALLNAAWDRHGEDEFDLVSNFSVELPLAVISELLGIPHDLRSEIHHLSNLFVARGDHVDPVKQAQGMGQLRDIYLNLTKERRKAPKDDPISMLIAIEAEDEDGVKQKLSDDEVAARFMEMGFAGHETVAKAIPNGAMALQNFPGERARLAADLSLMPQAVQEILRFDPPSQLQGRLSVRDITMHGITIPADSRVMLATGGAMRDERAFPDPDRFNIGRQSDSRTVFFGYGVHKCLGIHLAQQEIAIAFEELFRRFPHWQVLPERATRVVLSNVRGVSTLPMRLGKPA